MTDTGFFFFLLLLVVSVQSPSYWLAAIGFGVGMFVKELTAVGLLLIPLAPLPRKKKAVMAGIGIAAVAVYVVAAARIHPATLGRLTGLSALHRAPIVLGSFLRPNGWVNLFLAFGFAWIPAIAALLNANTPELLKRWAWLIPVVFVGCVVEGDNVSRGMFAVFPVVLPLAAFALEQWVTLAANP
jgi:hypothetical protein